MPMPRRREPTVMVSFRIPEKLFIELRILLARADGNVRYGDWGRTLERALREWVDAQKVRP